MKTGLSLAIGILVLGLAIGCGPSTGELDDAYMADAEQIGKARREIFVRAEGNFDSMSAEDREAYLRGFDGNEENAKRFWDLMKNPPTSAAPSGMPTN